MYLTYLSSDEFSSFLLSQLCLIKVNNLFTLIHSYLLQLDIIKWFQIHVSHFCWLNAPFMNTTLVMMSVHLCTQTGLHCLIIQVLNTRVWFLNIRYTSLNFVHSNLEHVLAILTESFSPLKSELDNLPCWSPKQKWCGKAMLFLILSIFHVHYTRSDWFDLVPTNLNCWCKAH